VSQELLQRWRALAGENADVIGQVLIAAWREPHRVYHDHSHLVWLLDEADRLGARIRDAAFVEYAIWFHDAVYQPGETDNEAVSAEWARAFLAADADLAERVGRVIEMTRDHAEGEAEGDAALFLDMDIAILGAPRETYCRYAAGVRREFGVFADSAFAAGRASFLEKQLARARTFRTDYYDQGLGENARANMAWELEEMRAGRMVMA
jgi:predicted metal-dependent HD superfamily phosphohydrolase